MTAAGMKAECEAIALAEAAGLRNGGFDADRGRSMTAAIRSIADINRRLDAELTRRARVRFLAETIPPDVDLDDEPDVIRALYAAGVSVRSYLDVLDDGIEAAKEARG